MSGISVELEASSLAEIRALLIAYRNGGGRALQRSINYGAKQGQKKAVDEMAKKANLTKKVIRSQMETYFSSVSSMRAKIVMSGVPLSLVDYKARQTNKGISFRLWKGEPLERYRHAFFWTLISERYYGVFEVNPNARERSDGGVSYRRKSGPSVPMIYDKTPGLGRKVEEFAGERMMTELRRQVGLIDRGLI